MFDIKENLNKLPDSPGVYIHKDKNGRIIYVGKALSLKNRVRQYFGSFKNMDTKTRAMVAKIAEFEIIETKTEMEALILECNLIKKYMPKYNIMLKDDKSYPYIKVTLGEDYPRLVKTRQVKKDGGRYFGPYANASAVNQMVDLLNGIYGLKRCSKTFNFNEQIYKPCLNYHIGQCQGICRGEITKGEYRETLNQVMDFLSGRKKPLLTYLKGKMAEASEGLAFEEASYYRDLIMAAEAILELSQSPIAQETKKTAVKTAGEEDMEEKERLREEKASMLSEYLKKITEADTSEKSSLLRIEAYDISTLMGVDSVGAMVVYRGGKPLKSAYRKFRIRTEGIDDTGSLQEVIYRRLNKGLEGSKSFLPFPHFILMDGGKGQVSSAESVLKALNLTIPVLGMVKDDNHRTRALIYKGKEHDISKDRKIYNEISKIQEEVHRFAISYHSQKRQKSMEVSELDKIPGVGKARKTALLKSFKSISKIKSATASELAETEGISEKLAQSIFSYFH